MDADRRQFAVVCRPTMLQMSYASLRNRAICVRGAVRSALYDLVAKRIFWRDAETSKTFDRIDPIPASNLQMVAGQRLDEIVRWPANPGRSQPLPPGPDTVIRGGL
ncbi:hypothetical protein D3876_04035 [Sphingomonas cavernae]|uniref:Uncharacterized protein n=1 Tax=Sphingomonas cavernae TaxID=2320861 RepID=A0A418WQG9_9SPHN|nr:hypothetical protein D3876_04035 [Sphingomonas cavernae]